MGAVSRAASASPAAVEVVSRRRLAPGVLGLEISRPPGFRFLPGQFVRLSLGGLTRSYTLTNAPGDPTLTLCIRLVAGGRMTTRLVEIPAGARLSITGPHGYFTFRASPRRAVLASTGTGVAPFLAMARAGVRAYLLLRGVSRAGDLHDDDLLRSAVEIYAPCVSRSADKARSIPGGHRGRVSDYAGERLEPGGYDFYLCGRSEMLGDMIRIIDERFPESLVYTESFF